MIVVLLVEEKVLAIRTKKTLVHMHAGTVDTGDRLGHEGRVKIVVCCDIFQCVLQCSCLIRDYECISIAEVNLMLTVGNFMVEGLNINPEPAQGGSHLLTNL